MIFQVFFLGFLFYEIVWAIIQRISIFVMNNLTMQNGIVGVVMIPNIVRTMNVSAFAYGWMLCAFFWGNPNEKIFLPAFVPAARFPASLETGMIWPAQSYTAFDFFCHAAWGFIGTSTRAKFRGLINRVNASEFNLAYRTAFCGFHAGIVA